MEELKESLVTEVTENKIMFNVVVSDNIIYGLETYMRNNDINAIALITHHKGVLERMFTSSHTRKIFSEIGKPLFVFHAR
jgi:nucleotide-binding universal stress UspA family protein